MPIIFNEQHQLHPFEIETIGVDWLQEMTTRPKGYHTYHLLQSQIGEGVVLLNKQKIPLKHRDLILIAPNIPHQYYGTSSQLWHTYFLTIDGVGTKNLGDFFGFADYILIKNSPSQHVEQMFDLLAKQTHQEHEPETNLILYDLLSQLKQGQNAAANSGQHNPQQLTPVIQYMQAHLNNDLNLTRLAQQIFVSPQYLIRLFRKYLDCSPNEYLTQLRIQKAKSLLVEHPQQTVSEIGEQCGFNSASYFIKTFKQSNGLTPNQFRKTFRY